MGLYSFLKTGAAKLGIGTSNIAFEQQMNFTPASLYGPRRNVRGSLSPQAPGYVIMQGKAVPASLLGDTGIGLQGQFGLTQLAETKKRG